MKFQRENADDLSKEIVQQPQMKKNSRTEHDLKEALRISANTDELSASKAAYLERSGSSA